MVKIVKVRRHDEDRANEDSQKRKAEEAKTESITFDEYNRKALEPAIQ